MMKPVRYQIRVATSSDSAAICYLLGEFNRWAPNPTDMEHRLQQMANTHLVLLATINDAPVGILVLRMVYSISAPDDEQWAEITEMYVRKEYRRLGIGKVLMEQAISCAKKRGYNELHLLVNPNNFGAQAFYTAMGFAPHSQHMNRIV